MGLGFAGASASVAPVGRRFALAAASLGLSAGEPRLQ
jgi:hypothetical protein